MQNLNKKQLAFTLAEILITLTIIGIIASLTIPNLIYEVQQKQYTAAWKKNYSVISQAIKKAADDNGGTIIPIGHEWATDVFNANFAQYLNAVRTCNAMASAGICWHYNDPSTWYTQHGERGGYAWRDNVPGMILADGTILLTNIYADNTAGVHDSYILVDINGFKLPNTIGQDIFSINVHENYVQPGGVGDLTSPSNCGQLFWDGWGCSAKRLLE